jgi:hypothetical protein
MSEVDTGVYERLHKFSRGGCHNRKLRINGQMPAADAISEGQVIRAAVGLKLTRM